MKYILFMQNIHTTCKNLKNNIPMNVHESITVNQELNSVFYMPSFSLEFNQIYTSVTGFLLNYVFLFEIHPHCCFQLHFIHFHQILVRQCQTYLFYTRLKFGLFPFYFSITNDTDSYFLLKF